MRASADRTALMQQREEETAKRLKRATENVIAGLLTLGAAATSHRVSEARLRAALKEAGWQSRVKNPPGPRRRTFGNGKLHATSSSPER